MYVVRDLVYAFQIAQIHIAPKMYCDYSNSK